MTQSSPTSPDYLPAAGRDALLPFYDAMSVLAGAHSVHRRLLAGATLTSGQRVLEIGCGTGNLAVAAMLSAPGIELTATDPDPRAVDRARRKSTEIDFRVGYAQELGFADATFDRTVSALMMHHVDDATAAQILGEVYRVTEPGGSVHIVDFIDLGRLLRLHGRADFRRVDQMSEMLVDAGFTSVDVEVWRRPLIGTFACWRGVRSA